MTITAVGQLSSPSGYFRTQEEGQVQFGVLELADEHPADLPLRLEHDLGHDLGHVLYIERHPRAGVWCVATFHDGAERQLDLAVPRYFSAGGSGLRKHRRRPDVELAFYDLQRFTMDEVSLVDDPAVSVGEVRFVPADLTGAGGWPNDLGHHARAVLDRARVVASVEATTRYTAHRRALVVHAIEDTPKAKPVAAGARPTPNLVAVRAMLAGQTPAPAPEPEPARHPAAATHHRIIEGSACTDKAGQTVHRRQNIGSVLRVT